MSWKSVLARSCLLSLGLMVLPRASLAEAAEESAANLFVGQIKPILAKYCIDCHGGRKPKGGLDLSGYGDEVAMLRDRKLWGRLVEYVEAGEMPPEGQPQPGEVRHGGRQQAAPQQTATQQAPPPIEVVEDLYENPE